LEVVIKTLRTAILEILERAGGCAREDQIIDEIISSLRSNRKAVYAAIGKLARKGDIVARIERGDMRRRIYCINRDRGKIEPREVEISV